MKKKIAIKLEKISDFYDEHESILVIALMTITLISMTFNYLFKPYDLIWNFGNMYKMFLGYKVYEEVAIIITPICFYIGKIFFKVLGANYFVYNLYNLLIEVSLFSCYYFVLKKIIKNVKIRDLILLIITLSLGSSFGINGPNYIPLSAIFVLLIVLTNMYMKNNKWRRVVNGFLAALAVLSYQKAGAMAVLTIIIYEVFNKEVSKKSTKFFNLCISGSAMIACVGAYIIYLLLNHNLYNFLDMTVLGIGDFSSNYNLEWSSLLRIILIGLITIAIFVILTKYKKTSDYSILLFASTLTSIIYLYPIMNEYHSCIWIMFVVLFITYGINMIFDEFDSLTIKQNVLLLLGILILFLFTIIIWILKIKLYQFAKKDYGDIYFGSTITEEEIQKIEEVNQYIDNNKEKYDNVIIFSSYAMLYKHTFEENNKFFDLPNRGNFGREGDQRLIDSINQMDNTLMLVQDEESEYEIYQFPENVRKYIEEKYEKIDKLQNYDIYEIKNKWKDYWQYAYYQL